VANNTSVGQLAHPNIVINLAFSDDGTKLATDSADGESMIITLWDVGTQTPITSFPTIPMQHFIGSPMALNADGTRIAVGYPDGSFNLWLVVPQQERAGQAYHIPLFSAEAQEVVSAVAFSPDGGVIAVAGGVPFSGGLTGEEQFPIFLLDAGTGATLARLDGHDSLIRDLAFSRDGRFLISAGDSTVKFWGVG
jgi:WD40 repeat protein